MREPARGGRTVASQAPPRKSSQQRIAELEAALAPFAAEGRKWVDTPPAFDGLKLLCGEDYGLMDRSCREAAFTIGDLKRAATHAP